MAGAQKKLASVEASSKDAVCRIIEGAPETICPRCFPVVLLDQNHFFHAAKVVVNLQFVEINTALQS